MIESVSIKNAEQQGRWLPGRLPNKAQLPNKEGDPAHPYLATDSTTLTHHDITYQHMPLLFRGAGGWVQKLTLAIAAVHGLIVCGRALARRWRASPM